MRNFIFGIFFMVIVVIAYNLFIGAVDFNMSLQIHFSGMDAQIAKAVSYQ